MSVAFYGGSAAPLIWHSEAVTVLLQCFHPQTCTSPQAREDGARATDLPRIWEYTSMTSVDRGSADAFHRDCQRLSRAYICPPHGGARSRTPPILKLIMGPDLNGTLSELNHHSLRAHAFSAAGKSVLRDTKHMTEEPRPLSSASSPFLLMDPTILRTFKTSRSTTDVRALRHPYGAGVQNGDVGKNNVQVKTTVPPVRNCEATHSLGSLHTSEVLTHSWIGTQVDQDVTDEEVRKNVLKDLMKSWMDRLQLISVIVGV